MRMQRARAGFGILFALLLAATSLTMATARGQTRIAGEIVICTGYGLSTISVDENGNPTGPIHVCPDMVLALMSALDSAQVLPERPETRADLVAQPLISTPASRSLATARARGPPLFI